MKYKSGSFWRTLGWVGASLLPVTGLQAQETSWVIEGAKTVASVQPTMWGIFFEDINLGADGGLYAELVKNRSFEFSDPFMGWELSGKQISDGMVRVLNERTQRPTNPRYIRIEANDLATGGLELTNEGFRGMGIREGRQYDFSLLYRQVTAGLALTLELLDDSSKVIGKANWRPQSNAGGWQKGSVSFGTSGGAKKGKLRLTITGSGTIDLDQISLFPQDTWKGRKGGLRADMVQALADLKPGFVRFPGGCIVEGHELETRYQWKKTVGSVDDREVSINRWNNEFAHRPAPDYYQTFGLGFYEYFLMAEDIGASPLPILSCGMACQFNTAELVPLDDLDPYLSDALDLIEFANGDSTTHWGQLRAKMGHPAPFQLRKIGIGNENWGPQYVERFTIFQQRIKAKYPEIELVSSTGPFSGGPGFRYLDSAFRSMKADLIDEHYYAKPEWFLKNADRYDKYERTGSKVFAGEFAAHVEGLTGSDRNNWRSALAEAAFMTGLERNAAVVQMASYAPLFSHIDGWQWAPDLIWVDNLNVWLTPNYYVQQLYSLNKGTEVVSLTAMNVPLTGQDSLYASAVLDRPAGMLIVKIANVKGVAAEKNIQLNGIRRKGKTISETRLQHNDLTVFNAPGEKPSILPVTTSRSVSGKQLKVSLPPYSFTVIRIPCHLP
ncbi:alpha-L-arabinofuranosidase C-terminal domain-containing protein [Flavihumibacter petaseus]|uniref:non-reducing end alpha-L-arabinofuranosidase n=1 Tax=Flavihumibacter petaseus NBRC 106054 TaxID=1220578 RepID=A0A0E9MXL9_9BACT|nr:alpha-L-arabinofuranosidase C-terminal domain-containing protein [Flavihumibacter petaseus]GAO42452.1 alpha-L-arabinofuranosidase [Flavihumibacter petaseus NBRC 106054]